MHDFWIMNGNGECPKLPIYMCMLAWVEEVENQLSISYYKVLFSQRILPNFSVVTNKEIHPDYFMSNTRSKGRGKVKEEARNPSTLVEKFTDKEASEKREVLMIMALLLERFPKIYPTFP